MPHFLVIVLTLTAALAALKAVEEDAPAWWAPSLLATALAPFAHESGLVCGAIVGGLVIIQRGFRLRRRDVAGVLLGGLLNAGALLLRARIPGAGSFLPDGLNSAYENVMFALQGLLYPLGPAIGLLAHRYGWHDFALIGGAAGGLAVSWRAGHPGARDRARWLDRRAMDRALSVVVGLGHAARDRALSLWWLGQLAPFLCPGGGGHRDVVGRDPCPLAQVPLSHQRTFPEAWEKGSFQEKGVGVFKSCCPGRCWAQRASKDVAPGTGARAYSKDIAQADAGEIFGCRAEDEGRRAAELVGADRALVGRLEPPTFAWAQRGAHQAIAHVYQQILEAAEDKGNAPLGFVNVPAWLTPRDQTYALSKDGAVMLPLYTNVRRYIAVNRQERAAKCCMSTSCKSRRTSGGFHGDWLDGEQMRQFAVEHRSVWLARWEGQGRAGRFELHHVGAIVEDQPPVESPLARFEGGPALESASVQRQDRGRWTVTLTWRAEGPVEANVFVHVVDAARNLVAQADGPALGGMVPLSVWQPGDRVVDVRRLTLPDDRRAVHRAGRSVQCRRTAPGVRGGRAPAG